AEQRPADEMEEDSPVEPAVRGHIEAHRRGDHDHDGDAGLRQGHQIGETDRDRPARFLGERGGRDGFDRRVHARAGSSADGIRTGPRWHIRVTPSDVARSDAPTATWALMVTIWYSGD